MALPRRPYREPPSPLVGDTYYLNTPSYQGENVMAWLQMLFGMEAPEGAQVNPQPFYEESELVPPERQGLHGEYDLSGLAKRVALAVDLDGRFADIDTIQVAQAGGTVVLIGSISSSAVLDQLVEVVKGVSGATDVSSDQVEVF